MSFERGNASFQFGSGLTMLGKRILIIYGVIYVIELLCEHWLHIPVVRNFQLYPFQHPDFHFWQFFTHPFIHDPVNPLSFLINCLVFYFFSQPVENAFRPKGFLILFYLSAFGGLVCGLILSNVSGFNAPFSGMMPSILSLIVVFGLLSPESTILLMFVLPVKAKYLSYGTILITALTFLAKANPHGAYHLGGILLGYLYFRGPNFLNPKVIHFKYLQWKLKKQKSKFKVIDGGSEKDNNKPTIH